VDRKREFGSKATRMHFTIYSYRQERWRVGSGKGWSVTPVPTTDWNWRHQFQSVVGVGRPPDRWGTPSPTTVTST
jgi:hypothetical protein